MLLRVLRVAEPVIHDDLLEVVFGSSRQVRSGKYVQSDHEFDSTERAAVELELRNGDCILDTETRSGWIVRWEGGVFAPIDVPKNPNTAS
jgi:hypothetical protein